ncbi:Fumarylacetoacetase, partial [Lachnellula occidentalis]
MASWIPISDESDFSLANLPYGVFSTDTSGPRIGVAIGDYVLDMKVLARDQIFSDIKFDFTTLEASNLNAYAALGKDIHRDVRKKLQQLLAEDSQFGDLLRDNQERRHRALVPMSDVSMHLPMSVGDYTDFFVGVDHAVNMADIVAPNVPFEAVCPNFYHLPIAYHGRASSVVVSGTSFRRPKGQFPVDGKPVSGPCRKLDYEVELAAFIGRGNEMGDEIDVDDAEDHIFGFVLMNDWSARDFQFWESAPLGPFNGKNFCTTVSPWIVPLEALEPFRTAPKAPGRKLLPYLSQEKKVSAYDIPIRVSLDVGTETYHVAECNSKNVAWSFAQMIAHHTRGGCPLRSGDILATGTLSGPTRGELGCFMESTLGGTTPYEMEDKGSSKKKLSRRYIEDGDTITFTAQAQGKDGLGKVGFGV